MKKLLKIFIVLCLFMMTGCHYEQKDIYVIYTNDIHSGVSDNIGLDGLLAYKNALKAENEFVTLVDCGDTVQGSYISTASAGTAIIQARNEVGYDLAIFGNHEFDYGMEALKEIVSISTAQYLNANIEYTGSNENALEGIAAYKIIQYGRTKVAYIGVTTPHTTGQTSPKTFKENDEYVYDFHQNDFFDLIQSKVDECKKLGANYVILMAHLGDNDEEKPVRSLDVIENTSGIDVVLDGHSHSTIEADTYKNSEGKDVILSSTGTKLENIGQMVIKSDGTITCQLINDYEEKDEQMTAWLTKMEDAYSGFLNEPVFSIDKDIPIADENGIRMVRSREMGIGDFVADAYRMCTGADIGLVNGGGVRAAFNAGEISAIDLINVNPYGNLMCVVEMSGKEIVDYLEFAYRYVQHEYVKDDQPYGEYGSFMQVSGLKLTIDTSKQADVTTDENDNLISSNSINRISDVQVLIDGNYEPIDLDKTYTVASHNYFIKNGGCGTDMFLKDHTLVLDDAIADYEALCQYATEFLNGDLSAYYQADNRITIK